MFTAPRIGAWAGHHHSIDVASAGPVLRFDTVASAVWPTSNLAIYYPVSVKRPVVVRKLWVSTGSTATGTYDLGVFDAGAVKRVSTGTQTKGIAGDEVWDVTDTTLGVGIYYLALVASIDTDTYMRWQVTAPNLAAQGALTESLGSTALPSTATWAVNQSLVYLPMMGMLAVTEVS